VDRDGQKRRLPTSIVYIPRPAPQGAIAGGETTIPRQVNTVQKVNPMGDKSPKANQKKSTQKETKANVAAQQKSHAAAAKQALNKKK
jgi:hypothetical protein